MSATTQETASNAIALAQRLAELWPRIALAHAAWITRQSRAVGGLDYSLIDYQGVASAAARLSLEWWLEPQRGIAAHADLWQRRLSLIADYASGTRLPEPTAGVDKRFKDKAWSEDPTLRLARDAYLINSNWLLSEIRAARTLDRHDRHKLEFYTRQLLSALSP